MYQGDLDDIEMYFMAAVKEIKKDIGSHYAEQEALSLIHILAGAKHPDADALITVTRSCGICTRFPFTLSAVQCIGKRHLLFFCSVRPALYHKTCLLYTSRCV